MVSALSAAISGALTGTPLHEPAEESRSWLWKTF